MSSGPYRDQRTNRVLGPVGEPRGSPTTRSFITRQPPCEGQTDFDIC
jgi:hypothetical protein